MKLELMDILACPICKGPLNLNVTKEVDGEIVEGNLRCVTCNANYLVEDTIPNLLPAEQRP